MTDQPTITREVHELRQSVNRLSAAVSELEELRKQEHRKRWRRLLFVGASFSILFHLGLLIYLGMLTRASAGPGLGSEFSVEFAEVDREQLTELEDLEFDDLPVDEALDASATPETTELDAVTPAVELAVAPAGSVPTLGGSGGGSGEGMELGGGGAGTSFFGISSKGRRFAFIVDVSGSMGQGKRLEVCMRELGRSVDALPDYALFCILLFETNIHTPPMQRGWLRARKSVVRQVLRWLGEVTANGGTMPGAAFHHVFALPDRPDVIFFLTDGEFNDIGPEEINALNSRGKKAIINTIGFGIQDRTQTLRQIASDSGGTYRFVASD